MRWIAPSTPPPPSRLELAALTIASTNEAACYISAKQRDDVTTGALAGTIAIVTISPDGILRVEVGGSGVYSSASELERDVKAVQTRLVQEIESRSPGPPSLAPS